MQRLYDSDTFMVVHQIANAAPDGEVQPSIKRHGFEIVDKRTNKEVYLDGSWAQAFQMQMALWQARTPSQEEVEMTLDEYSTLAQIPLMMH